MYRRIRVAGKNGGRLKKIYEKYTIRGSKTYLKHHDSLLRNGREGDDFKGNFHDYVYKAQSIFEDEQDKKSIGMDTKRMRQKIKKASNKTIGCTNE